MRQRTLQAALLALFVIGASRASSAQAPKRSPRQVQIHILVIEGDKTSSDFEKSLERWRNAMPGYTGAKLVDELNATVEEDSSVSLEILRRSGTPRLLRVTVRKIEPDHTVKLRVAIDALKLSTDTTHKNGATLVVGNPLSGTRALFLAITPKL